MAQLQGAGDHQGCRGGWAEFPKNGFQGLEATFPPVSRAVLQAQKHMAPQGWMQVRESDGNHTRHMAGPTHVGSNGIFEMKTRPPSLAVLLQTSRKGYLGCSFSEAS